MIQRSPSDMRSPLSPYGFFKHLVRVSRGASCGPCSASFRFSTSSRPQDYSDTIPHLKIGSHTRVIFQGFTGRQVRGCQWDDNEGLVS